MLRKINLNAGPAALPPEVLQQAADAIYEYNGTGISVLSIPHRSKEFAAIIEECNALVKELCGLGNDHEVVWLHGGGRMQFCMVPMNFLPQNGKAGYIDSGHWAEDAREYALYYGDAVMLASSKQDNYNKLPEWPSSAPAGLSYIHITTNNTVVGTQWHTIPHTDVPLIADMSSDIFSRRHDYSRYAMFYATAQKNLGVAGVAMAVIRKDMMRASARSIPPMLSYISQAEEHSVVNTANVFGVYVSLLMLRWTKEKGIDNIEKVNRQKAELLYNAIDSSSVFRPHVILKEHRSMMNVCFSATSPDAEKAFIALCEENNITGIKGHRSVGGFRVSLYNCITIEEVEKLVRLMTEFNPGR